MKKVLIISMIFISQIAFDAEPDIPWVRKTNDTNTCYTIELPTDFQW